jgi:hypothetical protein
VPTDGAGRVAFEGHPKVDPMMDFWVVAIARLIDVQSAGGG